MKVAVLTAGRAGSMSLYKACQHVRNYSTGHDSKEGLLAAQRVVIADSHIEIDTRFAWMLGPLHEVNGDSIHFVFLTRNLDASAASFNRRWAGSKGIIRGYCESILQRDKPAEDLAIARDLVTTVEANIRTFLETRKHSIIRLEDWRTDLAAFFADIGAEVDFEAAAASFAERHNASRESSAFVRARFWASRTADKGERLLKRLRSR
jgi:hypothetical protein